MAPDLIWRCEGGRPPSTAAALTVPDAFVARGDCRRSTACGHLLARTQLDLPAGLPPMAGGLFGYLGYDMVRLMERLPEKNKDALGIPEAILIRPTVFVIFDNVKDVLTLAAPAYPRPGVSAEAAYEQAIGAAGAVEEGAAAAAASARRAGRAHRARRAAVQHDQGLFRGYGPDA